MEIKTSKRHEEVFIYEGLLTNTICEHPESLIANAQIYCSTAFPNSAQVSCRVNGISKLVAFGKLPKGELRTQFCYSECFKEYGGARHIF